MKWLLRLVLFRVLGSRVMLALAVFAWFRSLLQRGRAASLRRRAAYDDGTGRTRAGGARASG
jgi:hypothetical protein